MFKGINQFWVGLGLGCGLVATWVFLGPSSGSVADPSGSELVQDPAAPSWVSHARGLTMAGNREYALPLNNPDTVSAEQATHLKDSSPWLKWLSALPRPDTHDLHHPAYGA